MAIFPNRWLSFLFTLFQIRHITLPLKWNNNWIDRNDNIMDIPERLNAGPLSVTINKSTTFPNSTGNSNMSRISDLMPRNLQEDESVIFASIIELYVVPVLVVIGALGNCLILLTLVQRQFCNWSVSFYLGAYAVGNLIILVPMVGVEWLCRVTDTPYITRLSDWTCKVWQFLMGVTIYSGIWFVFAMLVDQYIAIWIPYRAPSMCTMFMAKFAVIIIEVGLSVVSIHAIWTYELFKNGCYILHTPNDVLTIVWPWVSLSVYCIIPLVLIFLFTIKIIHGMCKKSTWKKSSSNCQVPTDITLMIIALSAAFVIFITPATAISIVRINMPNSWVHDAVFYHNLVNVVVVIGDLLTYLNPSLAFFICYAFSPTFRMVLQAKIKGIVCEQVARVYEMQVNSSNSAEKDHESQCESTMV